MTTPTPPQLVLVTGVSGYLGSNVAHQLLKAGYAVRGTARRSKLESLRQSVQNRYPLLELVEVSDIFSDDLTDILKGVYAVVHVAAPIPTPTDSVTPIKQASEGTLHILNQAYNAGVRKFVLTSSFAALINPDLQAAFTDIVFTEKDWGQVALEEALVAGKSNPVYAYCSIKLLSEKVAWKFAAEKPDFDLATILPTNLFGPYPPHFPLPYPPPSTTGYIYMLLQGQVPPLFTANSHDIRDCALAHVRALQLPPVKRDSSVGASVDDVKIQLQEKRVITSAAQSTWAQTAEYLRETRPDLRDRLPDITEEYDVPPPAGLASKETGGKKLIPVAKVDTTRAKELLGFDKWIDWRECIDATVDLVLRSEKEAKGVHSE
ncbi:hypothetical protein AX16_004936 [Volvariella volvacea WC 439]|nr:hypothetical protein AX16_004936 [Volvariella volvacea WC 439]